MKETKKGRLIKVGSEEGLSEGVDVEFVYLKDVDCDRHGKELVMIPLNRVVRIIIPQPQKKPPSLTLRGVG